MDYPYIFLLLLLMIFAYKEWKHPNLSNQWFKYACWIVFIFVAFRAPVVGADTWNYYRYAIGIRNFYNADSRELEPLYQLYNDFFRNYCPIGIVFMSVNTILIFGPIRYILKRYCKYKTLGILTFFLIYDYSYFFVALRQLLSLSIILWGVIWVIENRKYKWTIFIALSVTAWFMHTSAAIVSFLFLISYFIPLKSRIIPIIAICASAIFGIILGKFNVLDVFSFLLSFDMNPIERLSSYLNSQELNENTPINIALRTSFVALFIFYFMNNERINHWYSKIYLIGVILYNLFCSAPMINRMVMSNLLFLIFVLPWVFEVKFQSIQKQRTFYFLSILLFCYFTRSYIISNTNYDVKSEQRMHPYYFFFEDYRSHPSIIYF